MKLSSADQNVIRRHHICLLTSGRIFEVEYGGEEKFTLSLGNWLVKRGQEVTLMGSGFANVKAKRLSDTSHSQEAGNVNKTTKYEKKIRVLYPPYSIYLLSRLILSVLWCIKIFSINMRLPFSLIHAQDTGYSGLAAVVAGKLLRIPVIISSHGIRHKSLESIIHGRLRKALLNLEYRLDLFTIRNATSVIVVNTPIQDYYNKISSREIDFIPVPISLKNFEFSDVNRDLIRNELGIDKKTIILGYVGRFSEEKNLFTLLNSFFKISQNDPPLKLVLVGTGPLESKLRDHVGKMGIAERVIFCGVRYDVNRILSTFDIFILPSYIEGLPTALLEAMASGRAIVCSNISSIRAVATDGEHALLVDPESEKEIVHAIKLLSNDSTLRQKLGEKAKLRAADYDEEIIFSKILKHYETVYGEREFEPVK